MESPSVVIDADLLKKQSRSYANKRYYEKNRDAIKAKAYYRHFMAGKIKNPRATTRDFYGDQVDFENIGAPHVVRPVCQCSATCGAPCAPCAVACV